MRRILPTAVAIAAGVVVLLGFVFQGGPIAGAQRLVVGWAVTLAGLAVFLGVLNVIVVNVARVERAAPGWPYNAVTLFMLLVTLTIGILEGVLSGGEILYAPQAATNALFRGVVAASQGALAALVMFALIFGAARMLRGQTPNGWQLLFLAALLIGLVGWVPLFGAATAVHQWLLAVPVAAGARGILIGVALGSVVVGVRVLMGIEAPYRD